MRIQTENYNQRKNKSDKSMNKVLVLLLLSTVFYHNLINFRSLTLQHKKV